MIKDLHTISKKDLEYLLTHEVTVWEKLDMFYFRVEITKVGAIATKGSTGKVISDIDCVTNTLFKNVCNFVNTNINPVRNEILDTYGEGTIGFFYLPVQKYHKITYHKLPPRTVILSDWSYNLNVSDSSIQHLSSILGVQEPPLIAIWKNDEHSEIPEFKNAITQYLENAGGDLTTNSLLTVLANGSYAASGNFITDIEGIIIRTDKFQYQVRVNNTEDTLDKSVKLIYRDTLLKSVADYYERNEQKLVNSFEQSESYIDRVSKLFLSYLEDTDLFTRFSFDPEDLLPPTTAYFGDIDYDMISDANVKLICKYNEVNKNIFRLFLHTFSQKISEDKFSSLPEKTKHYLNQLIIKLKYKNYKEILLTAYKANS